MFEFGAILEGVRPGVTLRWAGSRSGLANNSLSRTDRAADEWSAQCLPTISPPINSPALKLCHERASDHWPYLVRPLGDGLSFSAHRRCDRAATKRSSASTFTHWRHCLIIGRRTLVFMISSAKVPTSDDIAVGAAHAPWRYVHIHGSRKAGSWRNGSAQAAHGNKEPQASGGARNRGP